MPSPRPISLALLAAAAISLVACNGDTAENEDYVDQVNEVQATFQEEVTQLAQSIESPDQLVSFYEETASKLDEALAELEDISPPDEVTELHDQLVEEIEDLAALIQGAADDIKEGGAAAIPGVVTQLSAEGTKIQSEFSQTINEINEELQG